MRTTQPSGRAAWLAARRAREAADLAAIDLDRQEWQAATQAAQSAASLATRTSYGSEADAEADAAEAAWDVARDLEGPGQDTEPRPQPVLWVAFEIVDDGVAILGVRFSEDAARRLADGGNRAWRWQDDERGSIAYNDDDPVHTLHVQEAADVR